MAGREDPDTDLLREMVGFAAQRRAQRINIVIAIGKPARRRSCYSVCAAPGPTQKAPENVQR